MQLPALHINSEAFNAVTKTKIYRVQRLLGKLKEVCCRIRIASSAVDRLAGHDSAIDTSAILRISSTNLSSRVILMPVTGACRRQ